MRVLWVNCKDEYYQQKVKQPKNNLLAIGCGKKEGNMFWALSFKKYSEKLGQLQVDWSGY